MRLIGFALLLLIFIGPFLRRASAEEIANPELADTLPGKPSTTYLDLAKLIAPDLTPAAYGFQGHKMMSMRSIAGEGVGYTPTDFAITWASAVSMTSAATKQVLVLFGVSPSGPDAECFAPLVLYDVSGPPRMLDAADVTYDRDTSFRDTESLPAGPDATVVVVSSTHGNAGQFYVQSPVVLARAGHLELVDTIATFNDLGCGFERSQALTVRLAPNDGAALLPLVATVTETTDRTGEDCGDQELPKAGSRTFEVTYKWNSAQERYAPDSNAFERLAKENEQRF